MRILFVDDYTDVAKEIAEKMKLQFGQEVFHSNCPFEALEIVKNIHPHIVVTDIIMPKMNGSSLCKEIKKIDPTIKVIFLTAYAHPKSREREAGCSGTIEKDISTREINSRIMEFINDNQ